MRLVFAIWAWLLPLALAAPAAAWAQNPKPRANTRAGRTPRAAHARRAAQHNLHRPGAHSAMDRWLRLSPQQRQNALRRLPPERRRALQQRLNRIQGLSPQQRRRLQNEYRQFRNLSPQEQNHFRRLYNRFQQLPADRRPLVMKEYRQLRKLSPAERQKRIQSERFQSQFGDRERQLLTEMAEAPARTP